ncbi:MAG: DUF4124 domain-containing protein [Burkholderiaceae bacterium]|nr:DUF4124 domain-containing protein [Burkholderiaceae bacterium]
MSALRLAAVAVLGCAGAAAQADVYTCTDAQGHYLTADRPIMVCINREQRVLDSSGSVRRVIMPQMTGPELARYEAAQRQAELERQRARDAARRDQVLLIRYPNPQAHEQARAAALAQSQTVIDAANVQLENLTKERQALDAEMAFYEKDPSRAPAALRRKIEDNTQSAEIQRQAIANQQTERDRINERFDNELINLRQLWSAAAK